MLNRYIWKLYLEAGGQDVVKKFEENLFNHLTTEYADFIKALHSVYSPVESVLQDEYVQLQQLAGMMEGSLIEVRENNVDCPELLIDDLLGELKAKYNTESSVFDEFSYSIAYYSTTLSLYAPDLYIPYYYRLNYNVLSMIADQFEIILPEIPKKADYQGRFMFYADLCNALNEFRDKNNWSPYELCAFLYDFAPKYIGGVSSYLITDLPEPRSAFFIGSSQDDLFYSDAPDTVTPWQCNPDTRAGDIILMYLRSPVSAVDSVWRSCSVGFIDPFFYYYRCTYIGNPQKMKSVTIDRLRDDKITGKMPIVKKNMQGINGIELKPSEYNRILQMGRSKAPTLESFSTSAGEYSTEKEVEEHIIKPLLKQLGYSERDYVQQLYLEIGNHNHALIPDFVLLPQKFGFHQSAFAIVEAKCSITSQPELTAALSQVRSYAKLLGARYAAIISQEKIWIFSAKDDFSGEILSFPVTNIQADALNEIRKLIGNY